MRNIHKGIFYEKLNQTLVLTVLLLILLQNKTYSQDAPSTSFGNTFIHSEGNLTVFGDHKFDISNILEGDQPGIIGSERIPTLGYFNFAPGATWIEADSTKYVDGYVRHFGNTKFLFPVGDNNKFRPIAVSGGAYVEASYFAADPTIAITSDLRGGDFPVLPQSGPFDASLFDDAVIKVSEYEYWDLNGSDPTIITLTWDEESNVDLITSNDLERLAIVGWNGAQWEYIPSYIDLSSISLENNSAIFDGPAANYSRGSISSKIPVVPSSYEVYTLASSCLYMDVDVSSEMTICLGEELTLSASTYDDAEIVWNTGETGPTITDSPTENTLYTVTAILGSCEVSRDIMVEVKEMFVKLGQDTFVCSGSDIRIFAEGSTDGTYNWEHRGDLTFSGTNNSILLENLNTPSTLFVTITDSNGCSASDELFIDIRQSPDVFTGRDASVCLGDSTFVQAFGSESGYGYQWSTGDTSDLIWITPTSTDQYEVVLTENGCSDTSFVTVEVFPQAFIEIISDNIICPGDEFTIETSSTQGSYLWSNGDTTQNITIFPEANETYSVTLTSPGNCEWIDSISFISYETTLDVSNDLFICEGETVNLNIEGILDSVRWSNGSTDEQISVNPLATTEYTVNSYYGNCNNTSLITVHVDDVLDVDLGPDLTICRGESVELSSNAVGQYIWSNGANANTIEVQPFSTSSYSVTVSSGGCIDEDEITVNVIQETAFVEILTDSLFCPGEEVFLQASGSDGNYEWSNGSTLNAFSIFPNNGEEYTVTVTNFEGCSATDQIRFTSYEDATIDLGPDKNICIGENVQLTVEGNYSSLFWSNGSTNEFINVSPLSTSSYSVTATRNGCESYDTITINVIDLLDLDLGPDQTICQGETVELSIDDINGTFEWSTGQSGSTIELNPVMSSSYTVTVSSGNCSAMDSINIIVEDPQITINGNPNYCPGESLTLYADASPGMVIWNNGTIADSLVVFPTEGFSYSATVITEEGCTANDIFIPSPLDLNNLNLGPDIEVCEGTSVNLQIDGNYDEVIWSTGETTQEIEFIVQQTENYSVTVTEGQCSISDTISINMVENVELDLGHDRIICQGETIQLESNLQGIYEWSTGQTTREINVSPLTNSTFYLTVTSGLCESIDSVIVSVEAQPIINIIGENSICPGDETTLTLSGSQGSYLWSTGDTTETISITPNPGEIYSVTVTTENNCFAEDAITISSYNEGSIDLGADIQICQGATVELQLIGNFDEIQWSTGESGSEITLSPDETVIVSVSAWKGSCMVTDNITIEVLEEISLDLGPDVVICAGQSLDISGNIAGDYTWNTGETGSSINVAPTSTTSYSAEVISGECNSSDEITVVVENLAYVEILANSFFCAGETVELIANGSVGSFNWNTGQSGNAISVMPIDGAVYSVTVTTPDGCIATDSIQLQSFNNVSLFGGQDINICEGETVELNVPGFYESIVWEDGSTDNPRLVQPSSTTTYSATIFYRSCSSSESITVNVNTELELDLGEDITICPGETIELNSGLTGMHNWSNGGSSSEIIVAPEQSTLYYLTVFSGNCFVEDSIWVFVEDPFIEILNQSVFCENSLVTIETVSSDGSILWSTGETGPSINVIPSSNSNYSVTLTSENGCTATDNINFTKYGGGDISLGPDITICQGGSIELQVRGLFDYVIWSDGFIGSSRTVTPGNTTSYNITGVYGSCLSFDQITVFVEEDLGLDLGPDITICPGEAVELTDIDSGGEYQWSTGESGQSIIVMPETTTTYTVTVSSGICVAQDEITVTISEDCLIDLYVNKTSNNFNPVTGDTIQFTLLVGNEGEITANNIQVEEIIRSGFNLISHQQTAGFYSPNTSIWYLSELEPGEVAFLTLNVEVLTTGDYYNIAQVIKASQTDIDSDPDNDDPNEDDYDKIDIDVVPDTEDPDNTSEIGDYVWLDANGDGYQDNSESGIENIEIQLYNSIDVSTPVEIQFSGEDGYFCFTGLSSGTYYVKFIVPDGMVITTAKFSGANNSNFDDKDSDIENTFGYGTTNLINLGKNEQVKTCDGGFYQGGNIGDLVWEDALGGLDDRYDQTLDSGVEGVTIRLYDFNMDTMVREMLTDNNGYYMFENLKKGDYFLEIVMPEDFQNRTLVSPNAASEDIDSDFDPISMKTARITLGPSETMDYIDAGIAFSPLPLTLVDFWGERIYSEELNRLFWTTESEFNTDRFVIERSLNQSRDFLPIGEVKAAGNSNETLYYTFDDIDSRFAGEYYYRLKMYDLDGRYRYSQIIVIKVFEDAELSEEETSYKIYPIPTTDYLKLEITLDSDRLFEGFLVNNLGQHVRTFRKREMFTGQNLLEIDVVDLAQGQYYLNFYVGEKQYVEKVLILD